MPVQDLTYTIVMELNENGGYTVTVPTLPGLVTEGETLEEAREMVREAILCYLEGLIKDGEPLPLEGKMFQETLHVAVG